MVKITVLCDEEYPGEYTYDLVGEVLPDAIDCEKMKCEDCDNYKECWNFFKEWK